MDASIHTCTVQQISPLQTIICISCRNSSSICSKVVPTPSTENTLS
uniref:BIG n=1 Tax=Arundo donax TaxID=35708 RepID=A0A0A9TB48_ARUDO